MPLIWSDGKRRSPEQEAELLLRNQKIQDAVSELQLQELQRQRIINWWLKTEVKMKSRAVGR